MAAGDVVTDIQSIAAGARLDIQPGSNEHWVIHSIYHEDAVTLERYDGTNVIDFENRTGKGVYTGLQFHLTNTDRIRVKNDHGSLAKLIGYCGVQTK